MELLEHDKNNLLELLEFINNIINYYKVKNNDNSYKSYLQPINFAKPKSIINWDYKNLVNNKIFKIISYENLKKNYGLYDSDYLWYCKYVIQNDKPLVMHNPLDWQLISTSIGDNIPDNKFYVNVNFTSEMFSFYIYCPGLEETDKYGNYIVATNHNEFVNFWTLLNNKILDYKNKNINILNDGRDLPLLVLTDMLKNNVSFLDDYFVCDDKECLVKKQKICELLNAKLNINLLNYNINNIKIAINKCGICYWLRVDYNDNTIIMGDLFYNRLTNKLITKGALEEKTKPLKWEHSFNSLAKFIK